MFRCTKHNFSVNTTQKLSTLLILVVDMFMSTWYQLLRSPRLYKISRSATVILAAQFRGDAKHRATGRGIVVLM
jgi:hypothetical protein